jgi:hypothetical protein
LINLAFINLPSNSLVPKNENPTGVLHKLKKIVVRRASICPKVNSTQKLLTLDFPTLPSLIDWLAVVVAEDLRITSQIRRSKKQRPIYHNLKR